MCNFQGKFFKVFDIRIYLNTGFDPVLVSLFVFESYYSLFDIRYSIKISNTPPTQGGVLMTLGRALPTSPVGRLCIAGGFHNHNQDFVTMTAAGRFGDRRSERL